MLAKQHAVTTSVGQSAYLHGSHADPTAAPWDAPQQDGMMKSWLLLGLDGRHVRLILICGELLSKDSLTDYSECSCNVFFPLAFLAGARLRASEGFLSFFEQIIIKTLAVLIGTRNTGDP